MTKVLDHGEVVLMDVMGTDESIGQAARVSYHPASNNQKSSLEGLIRYLMRHKHTSPFEMCEMKFYIKMPIFVARQWIRHRTANVNEMSGRYSVMPEEFYIPDNFGLQSTTNKQGTGERLNFEASSVIADTMRLNMETAFDVYNGLVKEQPEGAGVSRELSRIILPLSTYTEMVWKIDLHNLFHFLKLRTDPHAQEEIRAYASAIEDMVVYRFPIAYAAWRDYSKRSYNLSRMERAIIKNMISRLKAISDQTNLDHIEDAIFQHKGMMSERELTEFRKEFGLAE